MIYEFNKYPFNKDTEEFDEKELEVINNYFNDKYFCESLVSDWKHANDYDIILKNINLKEFKEVKNRIYKSITDDDFFICNLMISVERMMYYYELKIVDTHFKEKNMCKFLNLVNFARHCGE